MPELAEVETVRNVLKEDLIGHKIINIDLIYDKIFENKEEINNLIGATYKDILRYGKYLIFCFDKGYLLSHLRMEGKYFYVLKDYPLNKHMHVIFYLDNDKKLIYQDVRKFGRMHYYKTLDDLKKDLDLGPDANMALPYIDILYEKLKKSNKPIKTLLLEQNFIAGLGNIYVDEVLYKAQILPNRISSTLNKEDLNNILVASKEILDLAIKNKGTTIRSYTSSLNVNGNYQNYLAVHTKLKCPLNHDIMTFKIGGRTTYFCPICQMKNIKYIIGLTGSIASGKSNILNVLKEMGFVVADSDKIVKEAYNDLNISLKIKEIFNTIDRKEIAKIIFNNKEKKALLEQIIHPYVIEKLENIKNNNNGLIFLDIPLLYEAKLEYLVDKIVLAYLPYELELKRLIERDNIDINYAKLKIENQMSLEEKAKLADYIIDTSGSFKETKNNILKVVKEIIYGLY